MLGPFATRAAITLPFSRCHYCRTPAIAIAQAACDVHDDNDNVWQSGPLWPHGMGPIIFYMQKYRVIIKMYITRFGSGFCSAPYHVWYLVKSISAGFKNWVYGRNLGTRHLSESEVIPVGMTSPSSHGKYPLKWSVCVRVYMHVIPVVDKVQDQLESAKPGPLVDEVVCICFVSDTLWLTKCFHEGCCEIFR